jgi:predicted transcriptional regulator
LSLERRPGGGVGTRRGKATSRGRVTERAIVIRIPADLHDALKKLSAREDRPMSRIMRTALQEHVEAHAS